MATTQSNASLSQRLGQQFLGPIDDALGLARRYRELEALQEYVGANLRLVVPAGLLLLVTALACALTPVMLLVGSRPAASLAGLLLAPLVLLGSLFVLALLFFTWLEERALVRSLGHRTGPAPGKLARWLKRKLGAELGRAPRVPWLLAAVFVVVPLALLVRMTPGVAVPLLVLLVAAPILYARFDR